MGKNISIFDDYFEPQIRERGIGYYYNDLIKNIKTKDHTSTATIEGTRVYQVELKLNEKEDKIVEAKCNCPYQVDREKYCKHIYALLYALKGDKLDRSIISWSITYDECVENWWEVTEEDLGWESKVYTCNDWNHDYLKYDFWIQRNTISKPNYEAPDYEIWTDISSLNNERYVFNLDSKKNSQLIEILWRIPLPDSYQNSLIELFALTWNQIEYKNPNIENDIIIEDN